MQTHVHEWIHTSPESLAPPCNQLNQKWHQFRIVSDTAIKYDTRCAKKTPHLPAAPLNTNKMALSTDLFGVDSSLSLSLTVSLFVLRETTEVLTRPDQRTGQWILQYQKLTLINFSPGIETFGPQCSISQLPLMTVFTDCQVFLLVPLFIPASSSECLCLTRLYSFLDAVDNPPAINF